MQWLDDVLELRARKGIDDRGRLLIEGLRLTSAAFAARVAFERVLYAPEFFCDNRCRLLLDALQRAGVASHCLVPREFSRLSYKAEGLIGVVRHVPPALDAVLAQSWCIVLDGLSDPGNIGAVLRSANAWGPAGVAVVGAPGKLFHPKALRASMGALFHTPVCAADRAAVVARIAALGKPVLVLAPDGDVPIAGLPLADDFVIVVGNERHGVHPLWHDVTTARIAIPMVGIVDSLNVATSAAILLWEAFRARR